MSKKKQVIKNIELSEKFTEYLRANPSSLRKQVAHNSIVLFSATDQELNKMNEGLVKKLLQEGKKVLTAKQAKKGNKSWNLKFISP